MIGSIIVTPTSTGTSTARTILNLGESVIASPRWNKIIGAVPIVIPQYQTPGENVTIKFGIRSPSIAMPTIEFLSDPIMVANHRAKEKVIVYTPQQFRAFDIPLVHAALPFEVWGENVDPYTVAPLAGLTLLYEYGYGA